MPLLLPPRYQDILDDLIPKEETTILPRLHFSILSGDVVENHTIEGTIHWRHHSVIHEKELLSAHRHVFQDTTLISVLDAIPQYTDDFRIVKNLDLMTLANIHVINVQNLHVRSPHKGWTDPIQCPVKGISLVFDSRISFHIVG